MKIVILVVTLFTVLWNDVSGIEQNTRSLKGGNRQSKVATNHHTEATFITEREMQTLGSVVGFDIYNAITDTNIGPIANKAKIVLSEYGVTSPLELNFIAVTSGTIGSVYFQATGNSTFSFTENQALYASCGNKGTDFNLCPSMEVGLTIMSATPYSSSNLGGSRGATYSIEFTIVDSPPLPGGVSKPPTVSAPTTFPIAPIAPPTTAPYSGFGSILRVEIVNAFLNTKIGILADGSTVSLGQYGLTTPDQINFEAIATPGGIGSVVFVATGSSTFQITEGSRPYAACGNVGTDFINCGSLNYGTTTLAITPYSGPGGTGSKGPTYTIKFTILSSPVVSPPTMMPVATPTATPVVQVAPVTLKPVAPLPPTVSAPAIPGQFNHNAQGALSGELKKWHKITIGFDGPNTSETATPNPFTYYRLDVAFTHAGSGKITVVPGFYAADGNAANTGASSGPVWLVHFSPDNTGGYNWQASFKQGTMVAQDGGGVSAGYFDGATGSFTVTPTDKTGRDHRGKGRLQYVGEHYLRFAETGEYFMKTGADAPENFLAYNDFDNTPNYGNYRKSWGPHIIDYVSGDPTWAGGKGKGIIGAVNYLSKMGMNAFSFLTFNVKGDDRNVFMHLTNTDFTRIDVSKVGQWEIVLEHGDKMGMYLHFKTQENENSNLLDGGNLGPDRKLYYRELIARFGHHLALNWNLGEENVNTDAQRKSFINYIRATDPYDGPIVVHTFPGDYSNVYTPLLGYVGFTGVSIQLGGSGATITYDWVTKSAAAGYKWVVAIDEAGGANAGVLPDVNDITHDGSRKGYLYANIMNGGGGVEYYFGYSYSDSDLTCQDYRSRTNMWIQSLYALQFFRNNNIPFWQMSPTRSLVPSYLSNWVLATPSKNIITIYLSNGGTTTINLSKVPSGVSMKVYWYDPFLGGPLQIGTVQSIVTGGSNIPLGYAPSKTSQDWLVLMR